MHSLTPASAYWKQRFVIAATRDRIRRLHDAVANPGSMNLPQFAQLFGFALEFQPDLILELGRGNGNSTCCFTEAANQMAASKCRVASVCRSRSWEPEAPAAIASAVPEEWFSPLVTYSGDILEFDYGAIVGDAKRVLLFWDAHGFDIAECVLGRILPLLVDREHFVIMHDLSDTRYLGDEHRSYGEHGLWRKNDVSGRYLWLGRIHSPFEQAVAILDFATRNNLQLRSADESVRSELHADKAKLEEMRALLGPDLYSHRAQWFYFTLNERLGPFMFPQCSVPEARRESS